MDSQGHWNAAPLTAAFFGALLALSVAPAEAVGPVPASAPIPVPASSDAGLPSAPAPIPVRVSPYAGLPSAPAPAPVSTDPTVTSEISALRAEVAALRAELARRPEASSGDRTAYGTDVVVGPDERVDAAAAYGADVIVRGTVLGDATAFGGDVRLHPGARVLGDAVSFGGRVEVPHGARVEGDRVAFADDEAEPPAQSGARALLSAAYRRAVFALSIAGAAVLVVGLAPARVGRVAAAVDERPLRSLVRGALLTGALSAASVLLAVTFIGLPVAIVLLGLLGLLWLVGFVGLCQAAGDRLPFRERHHGRWAALLVACLILASFSALPWIGWIAVGVGSLIAIGGAARTRFGAP